MYSKILVLDKLTYAGGLDSIQEYLDLPNIEFLEGDIVDSSIVDFCVSNVNEVVHFAAETHVTKSLFDAREFVYTDVVGTHNLMSAIVRNRNVKFIHISTSEVYGTALQDLIDEEHQLNPLSPYAGAKAGADRLVYSFIKSYNLDGLILRPFNNYGPKQHLEKLVPRIITSAISNLPIRIHGSGGAKRDWVFVEDTTNLILQILRNRDRLQSVTYNIGNGVSTSVLDICKNILKLLPESTSKIEYLEDRPGQVERHTADSSKLKRELNEYKMTKLLDGLLQTINWYQQNRLWWEKRWDSREIEIILPSGLKVKH